MKIYTKTGDSGITSLIGGTRVPKHDIRIEAYGTVDELISWVGLLRDQDIDKTTVEFLLKIEDKLMVCASLLASGKDCDTNRLPKLHERDILDLEDAIDEMESKLVQLTSFILPGGHTIVSYCHIARNVCRRAERNALRIDDGIKVDERVLKYINRLSDYLFVLSRKLANDLGADEIRWTPEL